ncbi:MAG: protein kinase domain-containing protein [Oligoflexus sp.]
MSHKTHIRTFDFEKGYLVAEKYKIISKLGSGWEGEVYLTEELDTGIERTAKFFYPQRNIRNSAAVAYAKKLHKVRQSPVIIQYHNREQTLFQEREVTCLISEYVDGDILQDYINRHPRRRLQSFQALHLLHAMACGLESIHQLGEYHGDLHTGNVFVKQKGIFYEIKLFDLFDWKDSKRENRRKDICDLIRIFYDCLGGAATYRLQSDEIKYIICGLRRDMILNKFPTVTALKNFLETFDWN